MTTRSSIPSFSYERDLRPPVARFLRNQSFCRQLEEVPFYEHRMDVYGYSRRHDLTVAIELKLRRWVRAVEQAILYQLCSDLVYIAMPANSTLRVDLEVLDEYGLGLISVRKNCCRRVLPARPSTVLRTHYRERYLALVSEKL